MQILAISADHPFSQKTLADSLKLPYPLLSDHPELKVIRSYGVVQKYSRDPSRFVARRSFFLIDKNGIVRGKWIVPDSVLLPSEEILAAVRNLEGKP